MSFSFSTTAGSSQSTAKPRLEGNLIHPVKFESCKAEDIVGKKDPTMTYKVLKFRYSNDDGTFEHSIFEPRESDFKRTETEYTDKTGKVNKIPQPSGVESMMLFFKHNIDTFVPAIAKEIDEKKRELTAKDWDGLRKLVVAIMEKGIGVEAQIKLLKNKDGEATFPGFFTGLTKEGNAYVKNNFIGKKLQFSTYEADRIKKESTAKPTSAESYDSMDIKESAADDSPLDLNFDVAGL